MAGRLAHVGVSTMKRMIKCGLIQCEIDNLENVKLVLNLRWLKSNFIV